MHRNKKDPHRGRKLICLSEGRQLSDRNKKDPQRGRKLNEGSISQSVIEIKKLPQGDGNQGLRGFCSLGFYFYRNKKDPQRGRKRVILVCFCSHFHDRNKKISIGDEVSFLVIYLIYKKREFLIVLFEGSRTSIGSVYISARKFNYVHL